MSNDESNSRIVSALITALAMIVVSIIGFYGIKLQTETPIHATLTAQPQIVVTEVVAVTVSVPKFTMNNYLILPISVYIDGNYVGNIENSSSKVFVLDSYPVRISWKIVKKTTSTGQLLGDDMENSFIVTNNQTINVTNIIGSQQYFYPIINNKTNKNCSVIINDTWINRYDTNSSALANTDNVGFGYYKFFINSNVSMNCEGILSWWGLRADYTNGTSFSTMVNKDTGITYLTINP